jgi:hypothetical protein
MRSTLLAVTLAVAPPALAQAPTYSRADTLRYREVSTSDMEVTTPRGVVPIQSDHDAQIVIAFGAADSARAWYDALSIAATSPQGSRRPETAAALRLPFTLRFDARGNVETISAPQFPVSFEGVSDLTHQFVDVFLPLPTTPLAAGTEWQDSVRRETPGTRGRTTHIERVARYRVRGDSLIGTTRVWVIDAHVRNRMTASGEGPAAGLQMRSEMSGEEEGVFYFATVPGVLVGRSRSGEMSGVIEFTGGDQPVRMPQRMRYENSLDLLP